VHDDDVRKYLATISPEERKSFEEMEFGELTGS
jgi:hypothetical protein